jgi:hypothetical protein
MVSDNCAKLASGQEEKKKKKKEESSAASWLIYDRKLLHYFLNYTITK